MKSPPELWAELSQPASLARHLGDFGEIRITRLEPETAVAWEGELARGTVRLEPSGWGTRVVLTAEPSVAEIPAPAPAPPAPAPPAPVPDPIPPGPGPDPSPPAPGPDPRPTPDPAPLPPAARRTPARGLLRRLVRFLGPQGKPEVAGAPQPGPARAGLSELEAPEIVSEPALPEAPTSATVAILSAALDSLGQAHHRPFSRA